MEQEQRGIGMRKGGMIGHGTGARDARIEFSQPDFAGFLVDQKIQFEITAIAFLAKLLAEFERQFTRPLPGLFGKGRGKDFIAAPAATIGREILEADQFRHQRPNDGALRGGAGFDGRTSAINALHHLDFAFSDDLVLVLAEVRLRIDEKRRMS